MSQKLPTLFFDPDKQTGIRVDIKELIATGIAVYANRQSGKSHLVRGMLEQLNGHLQQLVIDVEGEYSTLSEAFDNYVIVGRERGDVRVGKEDVDWVVWELLRADANVIIDVSEYRPGRLDPETQKVLPGEKDYVIATVITKLMNLPRAEWRHLLIVVDEAQRVAPEGKRGLAQVALSELASQGGKRGFGPMFITQRRAQVSNELVGNCGTKIVGYQPQLSDSVGAGQEIGMRAKEAASIRQLVRGQFYVQGPAVSMDVVKVETPPNITKRLEVGETIRAKQPTKAALAEVIEKLSKLEDGADSSNELEGIREKYESEIRSLRERNAFLESLIAKERARADARENSKAQQPEHDGANQTSEDLNKGITNANPGPGGKDHNVSVRETDQGEAKRSKMLADEMEGLETKISKLKGEFQRVLEEEKRNEEPREKRSTTNQVSVPPKTLPRRDTFVSKGKRDGRARILDALARLEQLGMRLVDKRTVAVLANYRHTSGSYAGYLAALKRDTLIISQEGLLALSEKGRASLPQTEQVLTLDGLHRAWRSLLKTSAERRLFEVLNEIYPNSIRKEGLYLTAGYSPTSGTPNAALATLKRLGACEYPKPGVARSSELVFPGRLMEPE